MFDFERLSQLIQAGQFETVIDILQPISLARTSVAISLSEEDKQKLLGLLIPLHEYSMTLPENSPEFERLHQEESQARAAAVAHISPFDLLQEGAPNLSLPVPVSIKHSRSFRSIESIILRISRLVIDNRNPRELNFSPFIDFVLSDECLARGLLKNVLFQNIICTAFREGPLFYYDRLFNDVQWADRICQHMNPNYLVGSHKQSILLRAISQNASEVIIDCLIRHGADVNGHFELPSLINSPIVREEPPHRDDPLQSCYRPSQAHQRLSESARVLMLRENYSPLIAATLSGNVRAARRLLAEPGIMTGCTAPVHPNLHCRNMSPLMLASYLGEQEIVVELLQHGVNINEVDQFGESAIFYALRGNQFSVYHLLREQAHLDLFIQNENHQSLEQLNASINSPLFRHPENPVDRFRTLISLKPIFLTEAVLEQIEIKMPCKFRGVRKEGIYRRTASLESLMVTSETYIIGTFILVSSDHLREPMICIGNQDRNSHCIVVEKPDGTYDIRHNPYTIEKAYHQLKLAFFCRLFEGLPEEVFLDLILNLSNQQIIDMFDTPEALIECNRFLECMPNFK